MMARSDGAAAAVLVLLGRCCCALHMAPDAGPCTEAPYVDPPTTELVLADVLQSTTDMDDPLIFEIINWTTPTVSNDQCGNRIRAACHGGGIHYVWCRHVIDKLMRQNESVGLSYGVSWDDPWSQYMGDVMKIPTKLYDCYETEKTVGKPISQYKVPYTRYDICLGNGTMTADTGKYKFETLRAHLKARPPLSVLVKIDIEGWEWDVLPQFLASPSDVDAVALIDLEFHFCSEKKRSWSHVVQIFHQLLDNFVIAGRYPNDNNDRVTRYPGAFSNSEECGGKNGMPTIISASYINKKMFT